MPQMPQHIGTLSRSLTLTHLVFYGVGTIVGAGIYSVLGAAAGLAGSALWVSMLLAGAAAFLTALSYCELASMYPEAGAEYQFLKAAFPEWPALPFFAGLLIALNAAATSATVALAFAGYLNVFFPAPPLWTALLLLAACTALNILGIRQATWVSIGLILLEVGGLIVLVVAGLGHGQPAAALSVPSLPQAPPILAASALVFFVYIGFEDVANLSEEARNPRRDVPRALLLSVVLTSLLYLLVVWAVLSVVGPAQLAASSSPLSMAGASIASWLSPVLAVSALVATASTALISLVSISRLLFGMGRGGDMPLAFARTIHSRKTPWVAALVLLGMACALLPFREVKIVASISALGILCVFTGVHCALIALRLRQPERERPFRVGLQIRGVPVLPVLGICATLTLITQFDAAVYLVMAVTLALGAVVFWLTRQRQPMTPHADPASVD